MSAASLEAARIRNELLEYKILARQEFSSSEQVEKLEMRIVERLTKMENKFDEYVARWSSRNPI
jgi:hypothetical protein